MKPARRSVCMRLRPDLLHALDQYVQERQAHDDRTSRTEMVEEAIRLYLRRRRQQGVKTVA